MPTTSTTKMPTTFTGSPTIEQTKMPTPSLGRGFRSIVWEYNLSFTMNNMYGKIIFKGVNVGADRRSRKITIMNRHITPDSIVSIYINGFSQGISIPYVFVSNLTNGKMKLVIANSDSTNDIVNSYVIINYSIQN
jgi:hypothetical protein